MVEENNTNTPEGEDQEATSKPMIRVRRRLGGASRAGIALLSLAAVGAISYPIWRGTGIDTAVDTSDSEEFQEAGNGSGIGRIDFGEEAKPADEKPDFDPSPFESELDAQRRALEERNALTLQELELVKSQLAELARRPEGDMSKALAEGLGDMQSQTMKLLEQHREALELQLQQANEEAAKRADQAAADAKAKLSKLEADFAGLARENDALQQQIDGGMSDLALAQEEAERRAKEEAERQAVLAERHAEAQKLREAQIRSKAVVFDAGGSVAGAEGGGADGSGDSAGSSASGNTDQPKSQDERAREFVSAGAKPVEVTSAEVIANPSNTILQGTVIQATLETAIDSQLPGQIAATVNYPVYSFDQSQVLIPEGSRLIGSYDSDVSLGQGRVLVGWSRLVTPDGQSVELAAFGADDQGRSGLTGKVNSRFGLRFGSAALLSIVGAGPSIAAANTDSPAGAELAEEIGDNFSDTTASVIGEYAALPPIISVQPGAAVTVIVDRDLEFF